MIVVTVMIKEGWCINVRFDAKMKLILYTRTHRCVSFRYDGPRALYTRYPKLQRAIEKHADS